MFNGALYRLTHSASSISRQEQKPNKKKTKNGLQTMAMNSKTHTKLQIIVYILGELRHPE